ncbi:MAG: helix-turn-helix domain-containing protein [Candidatus Pacebacteria bacterium]|nr:helix-turn-helix domain-containing protein [Candidatus Paceibacterota bacterium]MCF7862668.1 helix-turn-helix domain-containing protein [Candidatus Paceibacterota bacterium]
MIKKNKKIKSPLKLYSSKDVFDQFSKSKFYQKVYYEEISRLYLVKKIRNTRIQKKMTQKTIAEKTKLPQSFISRIESGKHSFSLGTLYKISKALGKKIELV